jgi:hypothetical protein
MRYERCPNVRKEAADHVQESIATNGASLVDHCWPNFPAKNFARQEGQ